MKRSVLICLLTALLLVQGMKGDWAIRTLAGNGEPGEKGDFGKAGSAQVDNPLGITRAPDQSIWFCEAGSHRVRWIRADGVIFTFAGTGRKDFSGDKGPAAEACLSSPYEVKFDANGDLFIADTGNHVIRKVDMKTKVISTVAGTGLGRYSGDGDSANVAHLKRPSSIQFGPDGSLFIADMGNHVIRKVDMKTGVISTVAGTGVPGVPTDGAPLQDTPLRLPRCIDFDRDGNLWMTASDCHQIFKIDFAAGRIRVAAGTGEKGFTGHGGPARDATFNGPKYLAVDSENNVWIADTENHAVRKLDAKTGKVELVAGTGDRGDGPEGNPLFCKMSRVHGIFADKDGSILVADSEAHRIRTIRNETKADVPVKVFGKGKAAQELAARLAEGQKQAEAARQEPVVKAPEVPQREAVSKEEVAARLEAALKLEDAAKKEAIRALEEDITSKSRRIDEKELELAKREQALARKAQERKLQEMGLKQKDKILKEMESKEQALAARERELGLRSSKEKGVQNAALDQQLGQKKRELSKREKDLERKAEELKLMELERTEQELAVRERNLKRRAEDLRLKELERKEQDLAAREQAIMLKAYMLKIWELDRSEKELAMREKAIAERERALKMRNLERQEEELARREADVERRAKEVALRELERQETELFRREQELERRMKELSELSSDAKAQPPLLAVPLGSDSPVVYPLKPAKDERRPVR
jgi:streptogramin lyase